MLFWEDSPFSVPHGTSRKSWHVNGISAIDLADLALGGPSTSGCPTTGGVHGGEWDYDDVGTMAHLGRGMDLAIVACWPIAMSDISVSRIETYSALTHSPAALSRRKMENLLWNPWLCQPGRCQGIPVASAPPEPIIANT